MTLVAHRSLNAEFAVDTVLIFAQYAEYEFLLRSLKEARMAGQISVAIDAAIIAEFFLRRGKSVDVASFVENIVLDYLDRTAGDAAIWSDKHAEEFHAELGEDFDKANGDPDGFYQWGDLFLMNGTQIQMKYKGRNHTAIVRDDEIVFEEMAYTPSQLAGAIADNTNRNAWRDLWIKERGSSEWILADDLRRRAKARTSLRLEDF